MNASRRWLGFLSAALVVAWLMTLLLPVGNALWVETLSASGSAQLAAWSPVPSVTATATATATPTATPTVTPTDTSLAPSGTSLEAYLTAAGYHDGEVWGVRGQICVTNTGDQPTEGLVLTDNVEYKSGRGPYTTLPGAQLVITPTPPLLPGAQNCVDYDLAFAPVAGAHYRAAVAVTILNHSGWLPGGPHCAGPDPCAFGPEPKADFDLPDAPPDKSALATALASPVLTVMPPPPPADDLRSAATPAALSPSTDPSPAAP